MFGVWWWDLVYSSQKGYLHTPKKKQNCEKALDISDSGFAYISLGIVDTTVLWNMYGLMTVFEQSAGIYT